MKGLTIVVVDDDHDVAQAISQLLSHDVEGATVKEFDNASDAKAWMDLNHADLLVLDQRLPDRHGLPLLAQMRQEGHRVPCILATAGRLSPEEEQALVAAGVAAFVQKPFDAASFVQTARHVLQGGPITKQNVLESFPSGSTGASTVDA